MFTWSCKIRQFARVYPAEYRTYESTFTAAFARHHMMLARIAKRRAR